MNATEQLHIAANVNVLMMSFNYLRFIMFVVIVISVVVMVMAIIIIINNAFGYRVVQGQLFFYTFPGAARIWSVMLISVCTFHHSSLSCRPGYFAQAITNSSIVFYSFFVAHPVL